MPSAVSKLARGRRLESSIAATRFVADSSPKPSRPTRSDTWRLIAVGRVRQQAGRDQLGDALLAETLDVHGAARGEVHDPLHPLCGAVAVDAVGVALALETDERARRSSGRCSGTSTARVPGRSCAEHRAHDLGDDVSRLAHDDGVAGAHVLQADLVLVVQAGEPDDRAGDANRLQLRERRRPPGAPDRDEDVLEQRGLLLGRELVGDRPPGRVRGRTEAGVQGQSSTFTTTPSIS